MAMPFDDTPDRLDDHLNRLGSQGSFELKEVGFDPTLAETVRRFHAMDARDREPEPSPHFLRQLEEDVMNAAIAMPVVVGGKPPTVRPIHHNIAGKPTRRVTGRVFRRRGFANLAAAAVILLMLAAGFAAYRLAPSNGHQQTPTMLAGAQAATPESTSVESGAVDVAECLGSERPADFAEALLADRSATTNFLPPFSQAVQQVSADLISALPEADGAAKTGILSAVRQLAACRFYATELDAAMAPDLDGRYFSLYSDDYFRRELTAGGTLPKYWVPAGPHPLIIETGRALADGRVAVILWNEDLGDQGWMLVVFTKQGDRWLVDELASMTPPATVVTLEAFATPSAGAPEETAVATTPSFLELAVVDDAGFVRTIPDESPLRANEQLIITVANLGTQTQVFRIPEIGIEVYVEPGHSEVTIVIPPEGTFEINAAVFDGDGQPQQRFTGTLTFTWQGEGTMVPQG